MVPELAHTNTLAFSQTLSVVACLCGGHHTLQRRITRVNAHSTARELGQRCYHKLQIMGCCTSKVDADPVSTVLVIGPESAGKTTLLRSVGRRCAGADEGEPVRTMPTIGQEVEYLAGPGARVMLQEIGGCLAPTWPRYYDRAAAVLFVVDAAAPETWAEALVLLGELVGAVQEKPIGVVLNKLDADGADGSAARGLLGLEDLAVDVFEGSLTGKGALADDLRAFVLQSRPLSIK